MRGSIFGTPGFRSLALACVTLLAAEDAFAAPSASEILANSDSAQRLADVTAVGTLTTGEPEGETRVKTFTIWRRLQADSVHVSTLTRFTAPAEIRNEAILLEERPGDENEVSLYLPRFKKVRRVEAPSQSSSFMGSALSYSDVAVPHLDDFKATLMRTEPCPTDGGGTCFVVELVPAKPEIAERTGATKYVEWIRTDQFTLMRNDVYDAKGRLWKRIVASDVREVAPHKFFTYSIRVDDLLTKRFSTLKFADVKANSGLSETLFSRQNLARE